MKKIKYFAWIITIILLFGSSALANSSIVSDKVSNEIDSDIKEMFETFVEEYDIVANTPNKDGEELHKFFLEDQTDTSKLAFEQCYISAMEKQYYVTIKPDLLQEKYGWDSWYYKSGNDYSSAWTVANAFHNYLSYSVCQISNSITDYYGCSLGDIIQLYSVGSTSEVGHSTIITGFMYPSGGTDRGDIYVCCHTPNRKNVNIFQTWSGRGFVYHKIMGRK